MHQRDKFHCYPRSEDNIWWKPCVIFDLVKRNHTFSEKMGFTYWPLVDVPFNSVPESFHMWPLMTAATQSVTISYWGKGTIEYIINEVNIEGIDSPLMNYRTEENVISTMASICFQSSVVVIFIHSFIYLWFWHIILREAPTLPLTLNVLHSFQTSLELSGC